MISGNKSRIACNTGIIHAIEFSQSCHVLLLLVLLLLLLPVEEQYLNNLNSNKHENLHIYILYYFLPGVCTVWLYFR